MGALGRYSVLLKSIFCSRTRIRKIVNEERYVNLATFDSDRREGKNAFFVHFDYGMSLKFDQLTYMEGATITPIHLPDELDVESSKDANFGFSAAIGSSALFIGAPLDTLGNLRTGSAFYYCMLTPKD